jgi:hypothetical protein
LIPDPDSVRVVVAVLTTKPASAATLRESVPVGLVVPNCANAVDAATSRTAARTKILFIVLSPYILNLSAYADFGLFNLH